MKTAAGIIRKIDQLGRVVLPKELRQTLSIEMGDSLAIFVNDDDEIILKKYQLGCVLCGNIEHLRQRKGKLVCQNCIDNLTVCGTE
ncbi:MAG TPA: AbrB/MazE/SpoVT family DNA-binding domain-containing protein [Desulfosporosinus sp.]|nr:AbrB/MazE/SpoVT family DNA-binding domain-containing protein [Desulfosporosinus sp.]